jgi:hypothetical protein
MNNLRAARCRPFQGVPLMSKEQFLKIRRNLRIEEKKLEAGEPNSYHVVYKKFCDAQKKVHR